MAVAAGADVVLDPPDPEAALRGIREAVERGEIPRDQLDRSVERLLRAKARLGLHRARTVDVEAVPGGLGGRARQAVAVEIASKAITLLKDERAQVPLRLPAGARVLLLSVIDYGSGWREGAPGRVFVPELKKRYADATAVEVSDRTTAAEMDLIRALARRSDAVVAAIYVRIASSSGRMGLDEAQVALLERLAADAAKPFVAVVFGSPYVGDIAAKVPALLLAYEWTDAPEAAAARALCGEAPIGGKLPGHRPRPLSRRARPRARRRGTGRADRLLPARSDVARADGGGDAARDARPRPGDVPARPRPLLPALGRGRGRHLARRRGLRLRPGDPAAPLRLRRHPGEPARARPGVAAEGRPRRGRGPGPPRGLEGRPGDRLPARRQPPRLPAGPQDAPASPARGPRARPARLPRAARPPRPLVAVRAASRPGRETRSAACASWPRT